VGKNVAVFVDVANIFYAAKAAGVDIDYVTLLKSATASRDLVRAYAYTGLDPDNENQRNFHDFLRRHGYKVVSKDIRKYGDGKVKANLDIELVVDMMKTSRNLDIAIVVSGDGDFAPAIRAVQEMGVRCEVISFRGNTSSDLIEVADQFTDIIHLAKVEKGSSRSGRRVAGDDEDLSMTEVPDKQTEGTGTRGRGRGRGRGRAGEAEPVAASGGGRSSRAATSSAAPVVALPGERLSKLTPAPTDETAAAEAEPVAAPTDGEIGAEDQEGRRRRRRRGGRGRGRGRGREGMPEGLPVGAEPEPVEDEEEEEPVIPRSPRPTPFGSVWDSQIGTPQAPAASLEPLDDEDFEEPEIPEYLIAEQRRNNRGRGGQGRPGGRGARGGYAAAIERERFGRGGGGGGINRYPDVSGRERDRGRDRDRRSELPARQDRQSAPRGGGGSEPWSEVPPELQAMLRAQLQAKPRGPERETREARPERAEAHPVETGEGPGGRAASSESAVDTAAPKSRTTRRRTSSAAPESSAAPAVRAEPAAESTEAVAPKRRTTRRKTAETAAPEPASAGPVAEAAPPRRRTTRAKGSDTPAAAPTEEAGTDAAGGETVAPKRRTTRRKTSEAESA
jgi:uncharacterized LabA/DUF88 family protein